MDLLSLADLCRGDLLSLARRGGLVERVGQLLSNSPPLGCVWRPLGAMGHVRAQSLRPQLLSARRLYSLRGFGGQLVGVVANCSPIVLVGKFLVLGWCCWARQLPLMPPYPPKEDVSAAWVPI